MIGSEGIIHFINPADIVYLEASGTYTYIHYVAEDMVHKLISTQNLGKFGKKLDARVFNRVHKKYLVNINFVESYSRNKLNLAAGKLKVAVAVSKERRKSILETIALNNLEL
jgi:DNA-binding LytR/AlgR family response regulator